MSADDPKYAAEQAAALVLEWVQAARAALANTSGMTTTERNRTGELAMSAATWLADRAAKLTKEAELARRLEREKAVAHLSPIEQMRRRLHGV